MCDEGRILARSLHLFRLVHDTVAATARFTPPSARSRKEYISFRSSQADIPLVASRFFPQIAQAIQTNISKVPFSVASED